MRICFRMTTIQHLRPLGEKETILLGAYTLEEYYKKLNSFTYLKLINSETRTWFSPKSKKDEFFGYALFEIDKLGIALLREARIKQTNHDIKHIGATHKSK